MRRYTITGDNRIGSILISYGLSRDELQAALRFQIEHRDVHHHDMRLGDICVRLGYVPEWVRDIAISKQRACVHGPAAMLQLAAERTRAVNLSLDWLLRLLTTKERMDR